MAELQECITDDSWKQSLQSEISVYFFLKNPKMI